jgi:hypothetical protein
MQEIKVRSTFTIPKIKWSFWNQNGAQINQIHKTHHNPNLQKKNHLFYIIYFTTNNKGFMSMTKSFEIFKVRIIFLTRFVNLWIPQPCGFIIPTYKLWLRSFWRKHCNLWKGLSNVISYVQFKGHLTHSS